MPCHVEQQKECTGSRVGCAELFASGYLETDIGTQQDWVDLAAFLHLASCFLRQDNYCCYFI